MRRELQREIKDVAGIAPALEWVGNLIRRGLTTGEAVRLSVGRPRRTLDQNSKLHAMIGDVAKQVEWYGKKRSLAAWKIMFSAALHKQETLPNLDEDGFVVVGYHTSEMTVKEVSDLIEVVYEFGARKGVRWSEPAKEP